MTVGSYLDDEDRRSRAQRSPSVSNSLGFVPLGVSSMRSDRGNRGSIRRSSSVVPSDSDLIAVGSSDRVTKDATWSLAWDSERLSLTGFCEFYISMKAEGSAAGVCSGIFASELWLMEQDGVIWTSRSFAYVGELIINENWQTCFASSLRKCTEDGGTFKNNKSGSGVHGRCSTSELS